MTPLDRIAPIRDREARVAARKETAGVKVLMTKNHSYSPDGVRVVTLREGDEPELPEATADRLVARGVAVIPAERKAEAAAPQNKAEGPAPQNKAPSRRSTRSRGGKQA